MENKIEQWKPVKNYEGLYEVSNLGRIKTLARSHRYGSKSEKVLKPGNHYSGYQHVALTKDGAMRTIRIHRIVAEAFIDNPQNYQYVNHIDGVKSNNAASNLEWCDRSHNMKHAYNTGLIDIEKSSKLSKKDALHIRSRGKWGSYSEMSKEYGVSPSLVWNIINNRIWLR